MKKVSLIILSAVAAFAVDYSTMSTTDMQAMRGSVPEADRAAFQSEMQTRLQSMTTEERQSATSAMKQSKSGPSDGTGSQMRKKSGSNGMGAGSGSGKMYRGVH